MLSLLAAVVCWPASAFATPIKWTINGAFDDGGTVLGSYVYDADTNTYASIAVTTTSGSVRSGADYDEQNPSSGPFPNFLLFVTTVGDLTGTPAFSAYLVSPMTDAGGTIPLATAVDRLAFFSEESCNSPTCLGPAGDTRFVVSGDVTAAVPEPGMLLLVSSGLAGLAARRRRKA